MLRTVPRGAVPVLILAFGTATFLRAGTSKGRRAQVARNLLYVVIIGDLLVASSGLNPVLSPSHLAEPEWLAHTKAAPQSRFYVGGKYDGTLDSGDMDSSRAFFKHPSLSASASRAALSNQAVFTPAAWHAREILSLDLAVLWPRRLADATERFRRSGRDRRDRFLDRTGVRYRILPAKQAPGRTPVMPIPYFLESFLFDWGPDVMPRATVVASARVVPDADDQVKALFEPGWDSRTTAIVQRPSEVAGDIGPPVTPFARFILDTSNRVVVEAGAEAGGGYLVVLDSHSPDWQVSVDGHRGDLILANGLFRAVRLPPGRHVVEFVYRPVALVWGLAVSLIALMGTAWLLFWPRRPRHVATGA